MNRCRTPTRKTRRPDDSPQASHGIGISIGIGDGSATRRKPTEARRTNTALNHGEREANQRRQAPGCTVKSYALDDLGALVVQLVGITGVRLLLAVLEAGARVGLQHAVFGAVVALAEAAVADDALGELLAILGAATWLARRHDAVR